MIAANAGSTTQPQTACVTGATGMIGRRIVKRLQTLGYKIRVLTRRSYTDDGVHVFNASFANEAKLDEFICGADFVFNCAAELSDESKMHAVNVLGTAKLTELVAKHHIKYYCHLSSAGVVGRTSQEIVDEDTPCQPQNLYETTKLEAEKFASCRIENCNTIILRPTNVVDHEHLGELSLPFDGSFKSRLKAFIKGGECAHIVHADDVADAALFFLNRPPSHTPRLFFVSLDEDPLNTVANLWSLYSEMKLGRKYGTTAPLPHIPVIATYVLRLLAGRPGNSGKVRYSSKRLTSEGFRYTYGVQKAVERIFLELNSASNGNR